MPLDRLDRLRNLLTARKTKPNMLVSNLINIRYLSGFTGSNGFLIIIPRHHELLTDFRYWEQAEEEAPDWPLVKSSQGLITEMTSRIKQYKIKTLAVEANTVTMAQERLFREQLPRTCLEPTIGLVETLRRTKDPAEVEKVKQACAIADKALEDVSAMVQAGMREKDIAAMLLQAIRSAGGDKESFDPIVASGPQGARPHALAGERRLQNGEPVVIDFGAKKDGYCSDMTRTFHIGPPSRPFLERYEIVLKAQQDAIRAIRPGVPCKDIDIVARGVIDQAGYGDKFGHNLGHSVGLEVHETPSFAPGNETTLAPGMILSVEPGIYIEGWGGIRIEDLVVVTEDGCDVLTHTDRTPREL